MASVSIDTLILFIASMVVAASVAGVLTSAVGDLSNAIEEQGLDVSEQVRTDIEIISDNGTGACVYNCAGAGNLTLLVKNVGSNRLPADPDQVNVLVDARYQPPEDVHLEVLGNAETWGSSDVARLNVTEPGLSSGDYRATVIANGDEEVFEFRIP
jgi:flagellar protein FlaG